MQRAKTILILLLLATLAPAAEFSGAAALAFTRKVVAFGPRVPDSAASRRLRRYIQTELRRAGCTVSTDAFTASTPLGKVRMVNLIGRVPGRTDRIVVVSGHYDTKYLPRIRFVGANDGGSSTGFLLELAHALAGTHSRQEIRLVFFDGEEAYKKWSATDGTYGSRHLARKWAADGTTARIQALINVDMIGDADLGLLRDYFSTPSLLHLIWNTAADLGYGKYFLQRQGAVEDDHIPFLRQGVTAADLIDLDYGPNNSYWHTAADTLDKLDAHSFEVVGKVVMEVLRRLP